jgi:prepilin-type N-terminal cleavage/methylation domain-containing protein
MLNRPRRERGFTLVEMIVALVVFAVLIGAVFPLVTEMTRNGSRDSTRAAATGDARMNAQLLESDLRAMRAPLRPTGDGEDTINIIAALNRGGAPLPLPAANWALGIPGNMLWNERTTHDLLFAGPRALMFWADVIDNGAGNFPTELVRWYLLVGDQAEAGCPLMRDWCLIREVRFATAQDASSSSSAFREVLASGRGAIPPSQACYPGATVDASPQANPRVFCFQSQVLTTAAGAANNDLYGWADWPTAQCRSRWTGVVPELNALPGTAAPAGFRLSTVNENPVMGGVSDQSAMIAVWHEQAGPIANVNIHPLDRVTTIGAMVPGGGASNGATDVAIANAEVAIPSRMSSEYRTAILCGAR